MHKDKTVATYITIHIDIIVVYDMPACTEVHSIVSGLEWCLLQYPFNFNGCQWYIREAYGFKVQSWMDIVFLYLAWRRLYKKFCGFEYRSRRHSRRQAK